MKTRIRKYFLSGLLVTVPIVLTLYILVTIVNFTDQLYPIVRQYLPVYIPGFGIIITVCIILGVGIVTTNFLGKKLLLLGEVCIARIPLVKDMYHAFKQIAEAIFTVEHRNFRRVVLIQYPRAGIYTMAFVTGRSKPALQQAVGAELLNVFVPTTPNPTSGFYLLVPEEDVITLDMSTEEAFRLIVSGGMASN